MYFVLLLISNSLLQVHSTRTCFAEVIADYGFPGNDLKWIGGATLQGCMKNCSQMTDCTAISFNKNTRWCFLKSVFGNKRHSVNIVSTHRDSVVWYGRGRVADLYKLNGKGLCASVSAGNSSTLFSLPTGADCNNNTQVNYT